MPRVANGRGGALPLQVLTSHQQHDIRSELHEEISPIHAVDASHNQEFTVIPVLSVRVLAPFALSSRQVLLPLVGYYVITGARGYQRHFTAAPAVSTAPSAPQKSPSLMVMVLAAGGT